MKKDIDRTIEPISCSRCLGDTVFIRWNSETGKVKEVNCINYLPKDDSFRCEKHSNGQCIQFQRGFHNQYHEIDEDFGNRK